MTLTLTITLGQVDPRTADYEPSQGGPYIVAVIPPQIFLCKLQLFFFLESPLIREGGEGTVGIEKRMGERQG